LNRDPLGEAGGLNLYSYVANNPIAFTDDWGLDQHILNPNYGRPVFGATEPQPRFITVVTRNPPIVDFFADSFHDLFDYPGTGIVGGEFEGAALRASDDALPALIAEAERLFPKLCGKFHKHHIDPKYLGGDPKGPTATLPAPYHQLTTSAFRREWPYGQGQPPLNVKLNILDAV